MAFDGDHELTLFDEDNDLSAATKASGVNAGGDAKKRKNSFADSDSDVSSSDGDVTTPQRRSIGIKRRRVLDECHLLDHQQISLIQKGEASDVGCSLATRAAPTRVSTPRGQPPSSPTVVSSPDRQLQENEMGLLELSGLSGEDYSSPALRRMEASIIWYESSETDDSQDQEHKKRLVLLTMPSRARRSLEFRFDNVTDNDSTDNDYVVPQVAQTVQDAEE